MKIKEQYEYQIPTYALCTLINGDESGLAGDVVDVIGSVFE